MTLTMLLLGMLTIISACGVVTARQPLASALALILTLFLIASHFALLGAHFGAAIQVLIYAGAIMVLMVFVIMLIGVDTITARMNPWIFSIALFTSATFAGCIYYALEMGEIYRISLAKRVLPEDFVVPPQGKHTPVLNFEPPRIGVAKTPVQ